MKIIRKNVIAGVATLAIGGMAAGTAATTASASSGPRIAAGPSSTYYSRYSGSRRWNDLLLGYQRSALEQCLHSFLPCGA